MSAVVNDQRLFTATRELRQYMQSHDMPAGTLLHGCNILRDELKAGRTTAVAVAAAQKAMRERSPITHNEPARA